MSYLKKLGELIEFDEYVIFFGSKQTDIIDFETHFPQKEICLLKQTHGDVLHSAKKQPLQEGDAHWSSQRQQLLLIQTADCLPLMICSPSAGKMLAIHAGWRGVALQIVEKSLKSLNLEHQKDLHVWIGPHIQRASFEVQRDVAEKVLHPYHVSLDDKNYVDQSGDRFYIGLADLTRKSLIAMGVPEKQIFVSPIDTRLSDRHNSFRRGDRGGRNYSFITKI